MKANTVISFILGVAIGSAATFIPLSKKYRKMYEEDVASVKAELGKNKKVETDNTPLETEYMKEKKKHQAEASSIIKENSYSDNEDDEEYIEYNKLKAKSKKKPNPIVIDKNEFGENEDYDIYTLMYFADDVITDDDNIPIDNVEETVGNDAVKHFGEDPDDPDTVYVVNHEKEAYYEILADDRNFTDLMIPPTQR